MKSSMPIALAIVFGFSLVATAVYFGLACQKSTPTITAPIFKEVKSDWESAPKSEISTRLVATPYKDVKKLKRDRGVFNTTWRNHRAIVNKICKSTEILKLGEDDFYLEMPIEFKVDTHGAIIATRRFSQPRILKSDGRATKVEIREEKLKPWVACLNQEISKRVKFPPNDNEDVLRVWVRLSSSVD